MELIILLLMIWLLLRSLNKQLGSDPNIGPKMEQLALSLLQLSWANLIPSLSELEYCLPAYQRNEYGRFIYLVNTNSSGQALDQIAPGVDYVDIIGYYSNREIAVVFLYDYDGQIYWAKYTQCPKP